MVIPLSKKQIALLAFLVVVGLALVGLSVVSRSPRPALQDQEPDQTEDKPENGSQDNQENPPTYTEPDPPLEEPAAGSSQPPASSSPSTKKQIYPLLSALGYDDSTQKVFAYGSVEGQLNATCTIIFEKVGYVSVEKSGPTEVKSNNKTVCPNFEVPKSSFPASGEWTARLRIYSGDVEGSSGPGMVTIY